MAKTKKKSTSKSKDLYNYQTLDDATRKKIVVELQKSYLMELETVVNYLTNSVYLDGMLAKEVKESLGDDVDEELGHARQLAMRIKILGGDIPASRELKMQQASLQPPESTTDVVSVIKGVIEAEAAAINQYQKIIEMTGEETDPVTQDLCIQLKGDEEEHLREFIGYLREYDALVAMIK